MTLLGAFALIIVCVQGHVVAGVGLSEEDEERLGKNTN